MPKKQSPNKKPKPGYNKGKKYNKPLSLHGMKLEEVVRLALKAKPAQ